MGGVHGGSAASWERRRALDVWYVDNWSLALDCKILLMAVVKGMRRENTSGEGLPPCRAWTTTPRGQAHAGRRSSDLAPARGCWLAHQARA